MKILKEGMSVERDDFSSFRIAGNEGKDSFSVRTDAVKEVVNGALVPPSGVTIGKPVTLVKLDHPILKDLEGDIEEIGNVYVIGTRDEIAALVRQTNKHERNERFRWQ